MPRAIERVCALQAQWPTAPYVALWSRVRRLPPRCADARARTAHGDPLDADADDDPHAQPGRLPRARDALADPAPRASTSGDGGDVEVDETAARLALAGGERTYTDLNRELGEAFSRRFGPLVPLAHRPAGRHVAASRPDAARRGRALARRHIRRRACRRDAARRAVPARLRARLARRPPSLLGPADAGPGLRAGDARAAAAALPRRGGTGSCSTSPACPLPRPRHDGTAALPRPLGQRADRLRPAGTHSPGRVLAGRNIGHAGDQVVLVDGFVAAIWTVERASNRGDAAPGATRAVAADDAARGRDGGRDSPRVARARVRAGKRVRWS